MTHKEVDRSTAWRGVWMPESPLPPPPPPLFMNRSANEGLVVRVKDFDAGRCEYGEECAGSAFAELVWLRKTVTQ